MVERLVALAAGAGLPMTHLAMAFTIAHPGVTCALLGARTEAHLDDLLAGLDVTLSDDVLDRIDEIVPPGTDVGAAYQPPAIEDAILRRRPLAHAPRPEPATTAHANRPTPPDVALDPVGARSPGCRMRQTVDGRGQAMSDGRDGDAAQFSALSHLECSRDGSRHDADVVQGTSPLGAPLLARYDLERAAAAVTRAEIAGRPPDLWRYHELLPVRDPARVVTLGEGMTPLLDLPRHGARLGVRRLRMKDEGLVPTGSFKARGAAVGVSRAAELGVTGIAMPTNGNAGAAWAAYAARAGMRALVAMPVDAPVITRRECVVAGCELYLVDGLIGDAGVLVRTAVETREGYQDVSTLREPYRIEGKKTMAYEIIEQLGWRAPDVILYPTGGGVGIIAIHKALLEMRELGWLTGDLPRLIAVQAAGCAPIVEAFDAGLAESSPATDAHTVAFGITVPKALGDFLVLDAVRSTGGTAIAVTDDELLAAQAALARDEGTWICPEGAACFAAVAQLRESGLLSATDEVVVLNTGTGLIYPDTVAVDVPILPRNGVIPDPVGRRG